MNLKRKRKKKKPSHSVSANYGPSTMANCKNERKKKDLNATLEEQKKKEKNQTELLSEICMKPIRKYARIEP